MSWTIALAVVLSGLPSACSSGDGDGGQPCTAAPITITQGTWCITITGTANTCGSGVVPPYTANFTQSGSTLAATSQGATYTGSLCGTSGTMSGTSNSATVLVQVEFSDPSHASGTSDWTATACSGRDTFTAHSGGCP